MSVTTTESDPRGTRYSSRRSYPALVHRQQTLRSTTWLTTQELAIISAAPIPSFHPIAYRKGLHFIRLVRHVSC